MVVSFCCICSDTKRDRCGMYPKKTLSAASLLSECERKRRRSLEARGCAKSESEFSMGTAATCPFPMSEQSPRSIKLRQSVYARSNDQALRQTETHTTPASFRKSSSLIPASLAASRIDNKFFFTKFIKVLRAPRILP